MPRPRKDTSKMTPEEAKAYQEKRDKENERLKKWRSDPLIAEHLREKNRRKYAEKKRVIDAKIAEQYPDAKIEVFDIEHISVDDYERCECFLLRWMCENFKGVNLPEMVEKRLQLLIRACDEYLRIDDHRGYMQIVMT